MEALRDILSFCIIVLWGKKLNFQKSNLFYASSMVDPSRAEFVQVLGVSGGSTINLWGCLLLWVKISVWICGEKKCRKIEERDKLVFLLGW